MNPIGLPGNITLSGVWFFNFQCVHESDIIVQLSALGANLCTGRDGERIRVKLNLRFGQELIFHGPHDSWEKRLDLSEYCPYRGPQTPVLFFHPNGNVDVRNDAESMESYYRYLGIDWDELYPSPEPEPEEEVE